MGGSSWRFSISMPIQGYKEDDVSIYSYLTCVYILYTYTTSQCFVQQQLAYQHFEVILYTIPHGTTQHVLFLRMYPPANKASSKSCSAYLHLTSTCGVYIGLWAFTGKVRENNEKSIMSNTPLISIIYYKIYLYKNIKLYCENNISLFLTTVMQSYVYVSAKHKVQTKAKKCLR